MRRRLKETPADPEPMDVEVLDVVDDAFEAPDADKADDVDQTVNEAVDAEGEC